MVFQVKTHAEIFLLNRPPVPQTAIVLAIEVVKVVMVLAVLVLTGKEQKRLTNSLLFTQTNTQGDTLCFPQPPVDNKTKEVV